MKMILIVNNDYVLSRNTFIRLVLPTQYVNAVQPALSSRTSS